MKKIFVAVFFAFVLFQEYEINRLRKSVLLLNSEMHIVAEISKIQAEMQMSEIADSFEKKLTVKDFIQSLPTPGNSPLPKYDHNMPYFNMYTDP